MITINEILTLAGGHLKGGQIVPGNRVSQFRALRVRQTKAEKMYDLDFTFKVHRKFEKIKLPTARNMIETFMSHLPLFNPVVEVIPFKDKNPYKKRALLQQEFGNAYLRHLLAQTDNPILSGAKDLGIKGELFFKIVYDTEAWNNLEKKEGELDSEFKERVELQRAGIFPVLWLCPDPASCFPSANHTDGRPDDIVQIYTLTAGQIRRQWPNWKSSKLDTAPIRVVEFWSLWEYCVLADSEPLTDGIEENSYGFVPYIHFYSGWGSRDENNAPEKKAIGLLYGKYDSIIALSRWHSYLDTAVALSSMPQVVAEGSPTDYPEGGLELAPEPGKVYFTQEGRKVTFSWAAENLPSGLMNAIMLQRGIIEGEGQPSVLQGVAPRGIEAGYPMALMVGQARLKFGVALENLQAAIARGLELVSNLIQNQVEGEVSIWAKNKMLTLSPQDCEGLYRYEVEFDAISPEGRANRALVGQRLRQGGSISLFTELKEWQNIKDPQKEISRLQAESQMKHPAIQQLIANRVLREEASVEEQAAVLKAMMEGEAGMKRKAESTGIPIGGRAEAELPEDVLRQAIGRRQRALGGER